MKSTTLNLVNAFIVLLVSTFLFALWLYETDKVESSIAIDEYQGAFSDGILLTTEYPHFRFLGSRDNLSGIDQFTECFYALMLPYRNNTSRWSNALNPGFYHDNENPSMCQQAKKLANSSLDERKNPNIWPVDHKPRLWHGVKALTLTAISFFHLSQLHWVIKISTFLGFALISLQIMYLNRQIGLAYIGFTITAFYCSSVMFFGGISYSVPLLSTLMWIICWLGIKTILPGISRNLELVILTGGGTIHAFFYQLDGSLMYAIPMIFFIEIFLSRENLSYTCIKKSMEACIYYFVGFFGSILFKHIAIVLVSGTPQVFSELFNALALRLSHDNGSGSQITAFNIVNGQFYWYGIPAYGVNFINNFVQASKYIFAGLVVISIVLLFLLYLQEKREQFKKLSVAFIGILLMIGAVFLRYIIMRNHSDIHIAFVSRYLFVFAGTVYFYTLWLLLSFRRFFPKRTTGIGLSYEKEHQ
jgi:hypothetical protein